MVYRKSQIGWIVIGIMVPINILLYILFETQWGDKPLPMVSFLLLSVLFLIILLLFYKLTIEVRGFSLNVIYGIGLIKIKLNFDEILGTKVIRTPLYYGLGIRITRRGMLYNIQGLKAVEITYITKGISKSVMVGSSEPEKLKRVLDENFKRTRG